MRLASFRRNGAIHFGVVRDDQLIDVSARTNERWPDLAAALGNGGIEAVATESERVSDRVPLDETELLPPIGNPGKIICVGLNYRSHVAETGRDTPAYPMLFTRYPSSVVGHGQSIVRPNSSEKYDFEGELAVVIGRHAHHVRSEQALDYVAGYACFNDGSVRDFQRHTSQFFPGKSFWRSGAFGPWLVTADEIRDPHALTLTTRLNGAVMQQATTSDLLFDIPALIAYITQIVPLEPGDVIATGTTGGVGAARQPPLWMKPGDQVEVEISGIGVLRNIVVDERALNGEPHSV